ncbi:MAG: hypothetical protein WC499_02630 [Patescibacteria group bacterium]
MKILGKVTNKKLAISDYNRRALNDFLKDESNDGVIIAIESRTPESRQVRKFYHGAVLQLWAFLNGWDYRDSENLAFLHEHAKKEFNGEIVLLDGIQVKKGKSTKGLLAENDQQDSGYLERVIDYLERNYGIDRDKVLNPMHYKKFTEEIYGISTYESYIDYLQELGYLKR